LERGFCDKLDSALRTRPLLPARLPNDLSPSEMVKDSGGGAPKVGVADYPSWISAKQLLVPTAADSRRLSTRG